jgi:hypothetical protein
MSTIRSELDVSQLIAKKIRWKFNFHEFKLSDIGHDETEYTFKGQNNLFEALKIEYNKLNEKIPRLFYEDSRPSFVEHEILPNVRESLRNRFFDSDGTLLNSIENDVQLNVGDHRSFQFIYIENENTSQKKLKVNDKRLQIPIKDESETYNLVKKSLVEQKIIDPVNETIYDVSLLIGGTEMQHPHYDFSRTICSFLPSTIKGEKRNNVALYEPGWEINREIYNEDMAGQYAPSSIIIDLSEKQHGFFIGIPRKYFEDSESAKIMHGKKNQVMNA